MNIQTGTGNNYGFDQDVKENPFTLALKKYESDNNYPNLQPGNKIVGKFIYQNDKYAFVNCKGKNDIQIPLTTAEKIISDTYQPGMQVTVSITSVIDNLNYQIFGSFYEVKLQELSAFLDKSVQQKTVLTGMVTEMTYAGYTISTLIEDQEITLFMPHLLTDVNKLPDANSIMFTEIEFILQESYKEGQKSYLASRKAHLIHKAISETRKLIVGNEYHGYITGTTDFAVFVQFNECLTGMIHKSNLSPAAAVMLERKEILPGTTIGFYVKDITKTKLFLTQVMRDSLWDSIKINDTLTGKISALKDFGLMIDLDYETKGLLHKSVLSRTVDSYQIGQEVNVVVTNVDKSRRQITLALK